MLLNLNTFTLRASYACIFASTFYIMDSKARKHPQFRMKHFM